MDHGAPRAHLAEITHPDYPGERPIVCKIPQIPVAAERARKRQELLAATERDLAGIATAVRRAKRPLRGSATIGLLVGKMLGRYKVGKHFTITISNNALSYQRDAAAIGAEAAGDGLYVIRTNVPADGWPASDTVRASKRRAEVEWTLRSLKTVDLHVRPIHHRTADRGASFRASRDSPRWRPSGRRTGGRCTVFRRSWRIWRR